MKLLHLLMFLMFFSLPAQAEVLEAGDSHFTVSHTVSTPASVEKAWHAMTLNIPGWWHPDHSWSGDAANFYFKAGVGGCFCERLPSDDTDGAGAGSIEGRAEGGVEHLRIIFYQPPTDIRFDGSLGPLVDMPVQGRMHWKISPAEEGQSGSRITFTYRVHGYMEGGFAGLAPVVDGVIAQQIQRLQALLEL